MMRNQNVQELLTRPGKLERDPCDFSHRSTWSRELSTMTKLMLSDHMAAVRVEIYETCALIDSW